MMRLGTFKALQKVIINRVQHAIQYAVTTIYKTFDSEKLYAVVPRRLLVLFSSTELFNPED